MVSVAHLINYRFCLTALKYTWQYTRQIHEKFGTTKHNFIAYIGSPQVMTVMKSAHNGRKL